MRPLLPLVALLAAGCGAGASGDSAAAPPSSAASAGPAQTSTPVASQVDASKPYSQRGEK